MTENRHPGPRSAPSGLKLSEAQLQKSVIALAKHLGWLVHHQKPGRTNRGAWLTLVQGDVGFPDLVLCRKPRLLFVELKSDKGRLSIEQWKWQAQLMASSVEYEMWRPSDWLNGTIERRLK